MTELFQKILKEYKEAQNHKFAKNPIANFVRHELKKELEGNIIDKKRYMVSTSPGQGGWTPTPWAAIFDIFVTKSAQKGLYPVFIFRDDMSGFYLTLNQGVTDIRAVFKKGTRDALKRRASDFREKIGHIPKNFKEEQIKLRFLETTKKNGLADDYESANIIAKFYPSDNLPSNDEFNQDIIEILDIYKALVYNEDITAPQEIEEEEPSYKGFEKKQFRQHRRIERNQTLIKQVKKAQGYSCAACDLNFESRYGEIGKNFIEAHHLKLISKLTEDIVELDAKKDFIVLCSNCHRMIHRMDDPSDLELFKSMILES